MIRSIGKRLVFLLLLMTAGYAHAQTAAIAGYCTLGATQVKTSGLPSSNYAQGLIPKCTVTVYFTGTTNKATIYQDGLNTVLSNPFTASTNGRWIFWTAINNAYDVVLNGGVAPNIYPAPVTLTGLFPSSQIVAASTPAGPAFAVNFANSLASAFQGDGAITVDPTTHTFTAPNVVLTGAGPSALPVCPNGTGGALTTSGCTAGIAGNPAPPAFAVNFANSTTTAFQADSTVTINPTTHAFAAPQIGGTRYATLYQTGGGNNGIANAQANNQTVIADPSYASTELPGLYSFSAVPLHYQDERQGMTTDYYHNPNVGLFGMGGADSGLQMGQRTYCVYDQPNNSTRSDCTINGLQVNTPGFSIGNPPGITTSNWAVQVNSPTITVVRAKGITETLGANQTKYATGDNAAQYNYVFGPGGMTAASDEGTKAFAGNTQENTTAFAASCVAGCAPSSRSILTSVANGSQGNGLYLTDVTQTPISANVVSTAAGFSGATAVTIDATVPVSTAWGTLASTQNTPVVNTPPFTTNMTFNVNVSSGTFVAGGLVCFGGNFHEQALITSVSGSGPVTLVVPLRMPHITGSVIVQGGMCGSGLEETGSTTISGFRYLYDVIGSTTANTLQVVFFRSGAGNAAGVGAPAFINLLNTTYSSGTTVYGSYNNSGTLVSPWTFPGITLTISNSSDAALNAPCTNMQWSTTRAFTCTIVGLTGIHTTTTAPVATSVPPIKLWPMAEVLDVQNETTTPPTVDGTLALEPNVIQFAPSDTVVINHHLVALFAAATFGNFPQNPYSLFSGISVSVSGHGAANGGTSQTSSGLLKLSNQNLDSFYLDYGGAQAPPNMISLNGAYYEGMLFAQGPKNQGSLFYVPDTATHINNPLYNYNFFNLATKNGGFAQLKYVPNTANFSWNYGVLLLNGAGIITTGSFAKTTMTDSVAFANMTSPTPTLATSLTGGNPGLTDNTQYCYTVSPQNLVNVEQRGTEACITTGNSGTNSNSITVNWAQVPAATIYRVCRGTTGAEQAWTTTTGTESTTLFDNGSIGAGGTCLGTVGGSLGSVDNPASVNFNSSGSTFKGILKAPASLAGTATYTLPAVTATLAALASPGFTGVPTAPTPATADNSTTIATTAYVKANAISAPTKIAVSITPAATAATSCVEQTFNTFTGLTTGQGVSVSPPALPGTHVWIGSVRVSAANTLAIGFCADATGGTAAAGTYTAVAF